MPIGSIPLMLVEAGLMAGGLPCASAQPPEPSELLCSRSFLLAVEGSWYPHGAQPCLLFMVIACQEKVHRQEKGAWTL